MRLQTYHPITEETLQMKCLQDEREKLGRCI